MRRLDFNNGLCLWEFPMPVEQMTAQQRRDQAAKGGAVNHARALADAEARGETMLERVARMKREKRNK